MKKFKLVTRIDRVNFFSDLFIKYYSNFFKKNEFLFIVENTNYVKILKYLNDNNFIKEQILTYNHHSFGYGAASDIQNKIQESLINQNFFVVYVDIDEFIFSNNLKKDIIESKDDFICPKGYCIIQGKDEDFINPKINILDQRKNCFYDFKWYSKVCILKKKYKWSPGRHNKEWYIKTDENLLLLDIGKICKKIMVENNEDTVKIYKNVLKRYSLNNLSEIEVEYDKFYKKDLIDLPDLIIKNKKFLNNE